MAPDADLNQSGLVPIGRFSAMTRLSVKALRRYDDSGLLAPAKVDQDSGYRYYSLAQAGEAEIIRLLRSADVPLTDIAMLLAAEPDATAAALDHIRERLGHEIDTRQQVLLFLDGARAGDTQLMPYQVTTRPTDAQPVIALESTPTWTTMHDEIASGFALLADTLATHGVEPAAMPLIVFHEVIDHESGGKIELCIPTDHELPMTGSDEGPYAMTLPGGTIAVTVHQGSYAQIAPAYHVLEGWFHQHGHTAAASPREVYLNDPTSTPTEQLLTEVQLLIQ